MRPQFYATRARPCAAGNARCRMRWPPTRRTVEGTSAFPNRLHQHLPSGFVPLGQQGLVLSLYPVVTAPSFLQFLPGLLDFFVDIHGASLPPSVFHSSPRIFPFLRFPRTGPSPVRLCSPRPGRTRRVSPRDCQYRKRGNPKNFPSSSLRKYCGRLFSVKISGS